MGSTSALSSHLHLINAHCPFKSLNSSRNQRTSLLFNRRKSKFGASLKREPKRFNKFACFAVDDELIKQQELLGGGGVGSAVEEKPGIKDPCVPSMFAVVSNSGPSLADCPRVVHDGDDGSTEAMLQTDDPTKGSALYEFLYPSKELLPDDKEMSIFDHLEELRERIIVSVLAVGAAILGCFAFSKELVLVLEAPVKEQGVRFLQLGPGEFFFTTLKVSGYCGLLLGSPIILYEIIAFVLPGLTKAERGFLGPIVLGSSVLFYAGISFSYLVLTPAALNFFVSYAEGAVESLWSIDQYFEFVLVLMFSTGLSFQTFHSIRSYKDPWDSLLAFLYSSNIHIIFTSEREKLKPRKIKSSAQSFAVLQSDLRSDPSRPPSVLCPPPSPPAIRRGLPHLHPRRIRRQRDRRLHLIRSTPASSLTSGRPSASASALTTTSPTTTSPPAPFPSAKINLC
ncbi:hypothetical protein RHGRI_034034 [Rhododendron griersonianum]|uniref:Sec-independent protein translocase protein TATC, chloroplastic n=1 Tax=Rhododendron griersonianum TaxID=479676 RepID=A0AAV6HZH3_9ERIC|nr:hypothetical protein RHGRI_034034 [Rhododendron griersonianum]